LLPSGDYAGVDRTQYRTAAQFFPVTTQSNLLKGQEGVD
jgi:hypothetical protein